MKQRVVSAAISESESGASSFVRLKCWTCAPSSAQAPPWEGEEGTGRVARTDWRDVRPHKAPESEQGDAVFNVL